MRRQDILGSLAALACLVSLACGQGDLRSPVDDPRPNVLLIVADDLGYTDLGAYGGDIDTPVIDSLAARGVLFSQFHTAPLCSPSRAMLLSGNNNHVAGVGNQEQVGIAGRPMPGYESGLSDRIAPLPQLLRDAGYDTYMVGKWHLGFTEDLWPDKKGFDRSWALLEGGASHFSGIGFENAPSNYVADGERVDYPEGRHSSEFYTDTMIGFLEEGRGKPFFAYLAYAAPHWPLQVPDDYLDLYRGRYDDGYDVLRERRFASQQAAGIVPPEQALPPRNDAVRPWRELNADARKREARKMELYAALVDHLDDQIGRLIDWLKVNDRYDDTVIVFLSDNGAAGEDFYNGYPATYMVDYIRARYDNAYEKMGTAGSFVAYGVPWAEAGSAPFRLHKGFTTEGGIVAPMIVAGPGVERHGTTRAYTTVMDVAPTILEMARVAYPDDGSVWPMAGESMVGLLGGRADTVHADDYVTVLSHRGRSLARKGRYKLVNDHRPFVESDFALYDVVADPGETTDLRGIHPEVFEEMLEVWRTTRRQYGIVLPEDL